MIFHIAMNIEIMADRKFDLEDRLIDFACLIVETVGNLPTNQACLHLGQQLLRSGTSPALNYGEAISAESRKDFIHKLKIVIKELRESLINIKILTRLSFIKQEIRVGKECNELIAIFSKSISTAQKNNKALSK